MRWKDERQSDNVEDRRGQGGGFGGLTMRRGGIGAEPTSWRWWAGGCWASIRWRSSA